MVNSDLQHSVKGGEQSQTSATNDTSSKINPKEHFETSDDTLQGVLDTESKRYDKDKSLKQGIMPCP